MRAKGLNKPLALKGAHTEKTPNREAPVLIRLFPWKFLLRLAARRFDIIDPLLVAARIRSFAQPSEVQEPIELLRAGIIFHARGLLNTKAIQHNLDWVWPYWVERQFNPRDHSFIPRAFSFSHINLTHRNWTAIGVPDLPLYPLVDPRGLVTPLHDSWSIDCWFQNDGGMSLCPSRMAEVGQKLIDDHGRRIITRSAAEGIVLTTEAAMTVKQGAPPKQYPLSKRCRRHLDTFIDRQSSAGFFHSQDGEWDSNGQVLWLFNRYRLLSGGDFNRDWLEPIRKGAEWIARKRVFSTRNPKINGLPAIPASPHRRLDSAAIGCLVADYPPATAAAGRCENGGYRRISCRELSGKRVLFPGDDPFRDQYLHDPGTCRDLSEGRRSPFSHPI